MSQTTATDLEQGFDRRRTISLLVNGEMYVREVDVRTHLGDVLRNDLRLTGTHIGCEQGVCGACTVLLDGQAVRSCLLLAVQVHGREVTTIEGLADGDQLSPLQEEFRAHHALQCGFCTPGFLCSLTDTLTQSPELTDEDVREALTGNLCRCTGYQNIVDAALAAGTMARAQRAALVDHSSGNGVSA